jgi:pimeloyl-ACP methyl ester carboxylesterase
MPYAENNQVRVHYRVEGSNGTPLVLQHGFTESIVDWSDCGYVDVLRARHRLIMIDARGHGGSDKPHYPEAYRLEARVGDVVTVLDILGIAKAHFWGYSMGGWIGFGMAVFAPERVDRLVIGGSVRPQSGASSSHGPRRNRRWRGCIPRGFSRDVRPDGRCFC